VIGEIGGDQGVSRWDRPTPRLEMIEIGSIGALGRQSDPRLDIRLDVGLERFGAGTCSKHPARMSQHIRDGRLQTIGRLDCRSR
jgi:hypothetical protein